jgi:hypothetical protein
MRIRTPVLPALIACVVLLGAPSAAFADLTGFIGVNRTPSDRSLKGFAIGTGLLVVGFEFEYGSNGEDLNGTSGEIAPALKTYSFNGLLQTPFPIARMQFYGTLGGGVYHETLSLAPAGNETNFTSNVGGGAKITLLGPIRLRLDYRVFSLRGTPRHTTVQRIYAGVNLKF